MPTPTRRSRSSRRAKPPERIIAVTGAASGIGAACAARFSAAGSRVIGVDLHDTEIVADLGTANGRAQAIAAITESKPGQAGRPGHLCRVRRGAVAGRAPCWPR